MLLYRIFNHIFFYVISISLQHFYHDYNKIITKMLFVFKKIIVASAFRNFSTNSCIAPYPAQ